MSTNELQTRQAALQKGAGRSFGMPSTSWSAFRFFLQHLGGDSAEPYEDLYGLGIALKRIAATVAKIAERIEN